MNAKVVVSLRDLVTFFILGVQVKDKSAVNFFSPSSLVGLSFSFLKYLDKQVFYLKEKFSPVLYITLLLSSWNGGVVRVRVRVIASSSILSFRLLVFLFCMD
ncbi:hypothetical protein EUGRSUZ_J01237 [Eucalyptus grandis]|uniref:Uncharacterized protein n=2 Tax=Eucalyptus grandis TaxID=71139 RepID=A0ACC3J4P1_EUCGR|nr:hypothetical protein EUGRSUZ_J01237 [Eucalyptus grandis]